MAKKSGPGKKGVSLKHDQFLNRELQTLEFNRRVLAQAEDKGVPLLERLKFLCIVSSNLDEFFEIRVSGLKEQIKLAAATTLGPDGMTPLDVFRQVAARAQASSRSSTACSTTRSFPRSRRRASGSCAARNGRPRSRSGSATTTSAR